MPIPIRQNLRMARYLVRQRLAKREKYPLIVELEPLFACNLACPGCGKIQYPTEILPPARAPRRQAFAAIEECGAPMVSIAGGEPLLHPQIEEIVEEPHQAQEVRLPVHERDPAAKQYRPLQAARRTSPGWSTSTVCDERHDEAV